MWWRCIACEAVVLVQRRTAEVDRVAPVPTKLPPPLPNYYQRQPPTSVARPLQLRQGVYRNRCTTHPPDAPPPSLRNHTSRISRVADPAYYYAAAKEHLRNREAPSIHALLPATVFRSAEAEE